MPHDPVEDGPRSSLRLLIDPAFSRFFFGKLLANLGLWIHNIVAAILAYELTGSALVVGLVGVAQFVPQLLFGLWSGAAADRGNRKGQLILGRAISAVGSGSLALVIWMVGVEGMPGPAPVIAAAVIVGIGFVVGGPAMQALVPGLVRKNELATAVALDSVPLVMGRAIGPAMGAAVAVTAGPALAFGMAALSHLLCALLLVRLRVRQHYVGASEDDHSIRGGFRYLRADPVVTRLLIGVAAVGFGSDPAVTLAPALSAQLGAGTHLAGIFASAFGVGAAVGIALQGMLRRFMALQALAFSGLSLMSLSALTLALPLRTEGVVVSFGAGGVGLTLAMTGLSTQLHSRVPERLRGRVMALWMIGFLGSRPLAAGIDGFLADAVSISAAVVAIGIIVGLALFVIRPSRTLPPAPPGGKSEPGRMTQPRTMPSSSRLP